MNVELYFHINYLYLISLTIYKEINIHLNFVIKIRLT